MKDFSLAARLYGISVLVAGTAAVVALAPHSVVARVSSWMALVAVIALALAYRTYKLLVGRIVDQKRHVQEMSDLHLATIEALALAIDAKDEIGQRHVRRAQIYAAALGKSLGMSDTEIQGVKTASLLHDIGKLAVPDHILSKPGPLTQEEFQKIRVHPQIGAEIIGGVPFPYPVAPLILCHHERWDGKGYPAGLAGDEIPLGARILAVVDYFDALISDRPYARAMSVDGALDLLRQESGKALDPRVVRTFTNLYPSMSAQTAETGGQIATRDRRTTTASIRPPRGLATESANQSTVFDDIALAHREIYALYEIAQAMGSSLGVADTMALISSKLSNLVPFSTCALFLRVDDGGSLRCRYATGVEAESIQQFTIRDGHGLTGWVARHRRPLVNGRPRADFDAAGHVETPTILRSALVCPLTFNDRLIGALSAYHTEASVYTEDHQRLLERISEQAAAVLHHSIVFEQTHHASLTDTLTGLPNSRFMFMHLTRELTRADLLKSEVAFLVMDLDSFKDINDTYGHHVGDRALREVGNALRASIRPSDICVRYAGDEFIIVLSGCDAEEAERKRLSLQRAVDGLRFEAKPGEILPLALSAGTAIYPHDGDSYEALLATADGRMYRDKTRRKKGEPPQSKETKTDSLTL
jgi:diguanylate cyclase (GGDEF)-like protein